MTSHDHVQIATPSIQSGCVLQLWRQTSADVGRTMKMWPLYRCSSWGSSACQWRPATKSNWKTCARFVCSDCGSM